MFLGLLFMQVSNQSNPTSLIPGISTLLPLFLEDSTSVAIMKHAMNIKRQFTHFLNRNQTPVMAVNQPLFILAKLIQWNYPLAYREDTCFIMFKGFQIEKALLRVLGEWLSGSGWCGAIAYAEIASRSAAESVLKVVHITK